MMIFLIICTTICAALSLAGGLLFFLNDKVADRALVYVLPFAAGALLSTAFFDLLPEALEHSGGVDEVMWFVVGGFLIFLIADRVIFRFHSHDSKAAGLLIVSKVIHTIMDGMVIGVAFLAGSVTGIISTVAILAHEIPKETGDFAILLKSGLAKRSVIIVQCVIIFLLIPSAIVAFVIGAGIMTGMHILLAVTAGFFIYISACEIIPSLYKSCDSKKDVLINTVWLLLGIVVIGLILMLFSHSH